MSGTFGKFVLPSLFASGAVFTALSLPLVVYGSERVDLPLTDSIAVSGVVRDFTAPYLGLSGLISLAIGAAGLTLTGVGHSKKQAATLAQQYSESQQALKGREAEIQAILMSDKGIAHSGLGFFLDDVTTLVHPTATQPTVSATAIATTLAETTSVAAVSVPVIALAPTAALQPMNFSINSTISGIQPVKVPQVTVQTSISPMPAAHGFLGFMRSGQSIPSAAIAWLEEAEPTSQAVQLQDLQSQLQGLMVQIEQLQSSLQTQAIPVSTGRIEVITQSEMPKNNVTAHRFQPFEHAWAGAPQRLAA